MCQREPVQYPVERRPPRDWFSPIAAPLVPILFWTAILGSIAIIAYGSHNLGARVPVTVPMPEHSTYEHDQRNAPKVDLTGQELTRLTISVRNKDRDALMLHVHNDIMRQDGRLISGSMSREDTDGTVVIRPVTTKGSAYEVADTYLPALRALAEPGWQYPMQYADWVADRLNAEPTVTSIATPDRYVVITTKHLLFENRRNQVITTSATAAILLAFVSAFVLSAFDTRPRHRFYSRR